jgi:hypothetical protein
MTDEQVESLLLILRNIEEDLRVIADAIRFKRP